MFKVDKIAIEIKHIIEDNNGNYLRRQDRYSGSPITLQCFQYKRRFCIFPRNNSIVLGDQFASAMVYFFFWPVSASGLPTSVSAFGLYPSLQAVGRR